MEKGTKIQGIYKPERCRVKYGGENYSTVISFTMDNFLFYPIHGYHFSENLIIQ